MKRVIASVVLLAAVVAFAGPPLGKEIGTSSVKLIPDRGIMNAPAWGATNVVTQGQYISYRGRYYMVWTAGTFTNTAPVGAATYVTNGSAVLIHINQSPRLGLSVVNCSTNDVFLSPSYRAELNAGACLKKNGGSFSLENGLFQGAIYVISPNTGALVTAFDY